MSSVGRIKSSHTITFELFTTTNPKYYIIPLPLFMEVSFYGRKGRLKIS